MNEFGAPPGGSFPPPPPGYPPGGYPPQGMPPYGAPGTPGFPDFMRQKKESPIKYILIGCAILAALLIIAAVGTCLAASHFMNQAMEDGGFEKFGRSMFAAGLRMSKQQYMNMLSSDHTEEDAQYFSDYFDILVELAEESDDMEQFTARYNSSWTELQIISRDGRITVEESTEWVDNLDDLLDMHGYWDDSDYYEEE